MKGVKIRNNAYKKYCTEHWDTTNVCHAYRNAEIASPCPFAELLSFTYYVQPNQDRQVSAIRVASRLYRGGASDTARNPANGRLVLLYPSAQL
jgi:hypothetical protein